MHKRCCSVASMHKMKIAITVICLLTFAHSSVATLTLLFPSEMGMVRIFGASSPQPGIDSYMAEGEVRE